ncbi:uncharacterized protein [Aristolochia californica]|uniref:uncharacterized protein n=1 Tax=Aristolochia californica TaxID=171875 RepID=UPI0035D8B9DA
MAAGGEEKNEVFYQDFYAVLGLKKECSPAELRNAYKKLAMRWHPDRCSASGNTKFVEESKKKFQAIQEAYSVLSDANKRFLYDVGVYENDDDEEGMGDFIGEMAAMMSQTNENGSGNGSFEELQELFEEMFQRGSYGASESDSSGNGKASSSWTSCSYTSSSSNKRNCPDMTSGTDKVYSFSDYSAMEANRTFSLGANSQEESAGRGSGGKRRSGRKQKVSSGQDVSSRDAGVSA